MEKWLRLLMFVVLCGIAEPSRGATAPGPDAFGYTVARTSAYSFTNITNGIRTLNFNDDAAVTVNIGFVFNFYGSNYTSVSFSPNGLMTFDGQNTDYENVNLTSTGLIGNLPAIAVLWDDWETESLQADALYYKTLGSPGTREFVVQWNKMVPVAGDGIDTVIFQVRLLEQGSKIIFSYMDTVVSDESTPVASLGVGATVGIRDRNGQSSGRNLQWSFNQGIITNGLNLLWGKANHAPIATNDVINTPEDSPATIDLLANDYDEDGNTLTLASFTQGISGAVTTSANRTVTYRPATNYFGTDSFTYTISDGQGGTATGTVQVTVTAVNDAPTAQNDSYLVNEDASLLVGAPGVLANDSDVEGTPITPLVMTPPAKGSLVLSNNGSFLYQPNANINGTDSFTYSVNDGSLTSQPATVTITINAVNDAPSAQHLAIETTEDAWVNFALAGSDPDNEPLNYSLLSSPSNGSLGGFLPQITYRPGTNFNGRDTFSYAVRDAVGLRATGIVNIAVVPVNDPPVAKPDLRDGYQDTALLVPSAVLLANDSDPDDGDILNISAVGHPTIAGGSVVLSNQTVVYTPPAGFVGEDVFNYTLRDGNGATHEANVTVKVWPLPRIISIQPIPMNQIRLEFEGIPGRAYAVEGATRMGDWERLGPGIEVGAGEFSFETGASGPFRFYRIID